MEIIKLIVNRHIGLLTFICYIQGTRDLQNNRDDWATYRI